MEQIATRPDALGSLDLASLAERYREHALQPSALARALLARIAAAGDDHVWISRVADDALLAAAEALDALPPAARAALPLYGIPVAVKDNIDVAGLPTTAGCPGFAYRPAESAPAVARLIAAGALLVGKTNLDQFATGLVGVRSPYGTARNPFDPRYVPGGSSSGSAVAVASGLVSFALGTDTAGSGRVPAGFNNIVGLKPTRGLISTTGLVPACRSLDCISIFGLTVEDTLDVLAVAAGEDAADPFSRRAPTAPPAPAAPIRFGMPTADQLEFFGNAEAARLYHAAADRLCQMGGVAVEVDFAPFVAAALLLYGGPWVAERTAAVGEFIAAGGAGVLPVIRQIIAPGESISAVDAFRGAYRLEALRRHARATFERIDVLLLPTSGTIYTLDEVAADPIGANANLGRYTNFANLFDLCGIAVPAGFQANGLPAGVTLIAPAFREAMVGRIAARLHRSAELPAGATGLPLPPARPVDYGTDGLVQILVIGAHLKGMALNRELTDSGAALVETCRTAPAYRLYALAGTPTRPGMIRVAHDGASIEGELWQMTDDAFGRFVQAVPSPLSIGSVALADGRMVKGFLCEAGATDGATDITSYGGWRAWQAASSAR
jgi:allophanate hydrolase